MTARALRLGTLAAVFAAAVVAASPASARSPKPTITGLTANGVSSTLTITGTHLAHATLLEVGKQRLPIRSSSATTVVAKMPKVVKKGYIVILTRAGRVKSNVEFGWP